MNRLAITKTTIDNKNFTAYIALDEKRDFVDFHLYPNESNHLLEHIFIGRITHIATGISAAFVQISPDQTCFLPLTELSYAVFTKKQSAYKPVCEGDELLVQVTREAVKTKEAVVSAKLTLSGRYAILTTGNQSLSVSRKLPADVRTAWKALLEEICINHESDGYGIVIRTNAACASDEEISTDIMQLIEQYRSIKEKCMHLSAYSCLYQPMPEYLRRLQSVRNFSSECAMADGYDGIFTDVPEIYEQITEALPYLSRQKLLHMYDDTQVSLQTLYNIEGNIKKLLSNRIWLKSGANIIIEQLETLTFIDVNSAKTGNKTKSSLPHCIQHMTIAKKDLPLLMVNIEATIEASRQLRLRNISGMILIDFINMESEEAYEALTVCIKEELKKDVVSCQFIDITKLGLVEITRKKMNKSLKEIVDVPKDI